MRAATAFAVASALLLGSGQASAQQPGRDEPEFMRKPIESSRRQGFMLGVLGGATLYDGTATPQEYLKRDALHEVHFGPVLSPSLSVLIGDAPSDLLAFALQVQPSLAHDGDLKRKGYSLAFRLDLYPLVSRGGLWRDLGIAPRFGVGKLTFNDKRTGATRADSGMFSEAGLDLVWDAVRWRGLGFGPSLGYTYRWSATLSESAVMGGIRVMFWAGP
jgi:hypothetical protein